MIWIIATSFIEEVTILMVSKCVFLNGPLTLVLRNSLLSCQCGFLFPTYVNICLTSIFFITWHLFFVVQCFSLHPQLCKHNDIIRYSKENDTIDGIIFLEPISLVQDSIVVSNKLNHNISVHTLHQFGDASCSHEEYQINRTKNLILKIYHADVTTLEDAEDILIWASLENQIPNASEVFDVVIEEISSFEIMVDHDVDGNYAEQGGNVDVVPSLWNDRGVKDMMDCLSILD
ncbi:hypothetical protein IEQ34_018082 [Dendrobium chrysotoxum]|uniref:Uncharacterized protein n=1 Tax=Dendrobium chrysotoxum TaxID=161865 RepID=A0AAV7GDJ3_DENCH|nr:hypothetical protein IEQ34_018082 [Dendrobium chrysotoxum]